MPGPVLLFRQHGGLSWAGTTQRAQEYPPQHRETVSMGASPSPFFLPSHRGRISPSTQPGKSACGRNRFLGQFSDALQHAYPRGGGPSEKVKDLRALNWVNWEEPLPRRGGSLAAACPFPAPPLLPSPLETASGLWTSSFWLGEKGAWD